MMKNANSDAKRQLLPPPPGRGPIGKDEGMSTFLRLSQKTGLTDKSNALTKGSPIPAIARIFNAVPGVEPKDFIRPYRGMLTR